eukprot:scaffold7427_cov162-Cylindrotheca_fusiformis.AAC.4
MAHRYPLELEKTVLNADPELVADCGGDIGCIIDGEAFGKEAAAEYVTDPGLEVKPEQQGAEGAELVLGVGPDPNQSWNVCKARGWGDPHMVTFDGLKYDVHVKGELTLLKSKDPASTFEIQARTRAVENHNARPAVTTAVVVYEDEVKNLPTVQVALAEDPSLENVVTIGNCPVLLYIDGVSRDITTGSGKIGATVQVKGRRIVVEYPATQLRLDMKVEIWRQTCHFSVDYFLADCRKDEELHGLLGTPTGDWRDDWEVRDGSKVPVPTNGRDRRFEKAYEYSKNWCITKTTSHFAYEPGTNYDTFDECTDDYDNALEEAVDHADPDLIEKCKGDEGCVIEGVALGTEAAEEYLEDPANEQDVLQKDDEEIVTTVGGDENNVCEMCTARGWGDPHIITFDGVKYDVHVKGQLTFLKSLNSGFEIQARTEAVENHPQRYAVTTGIVVTEDNLPKIQVSLASQNAATAEN